MILFPFGKQRNGQVGIAFYDGGITIGQCSWKNGAYSTAAITRFECNLSGLTSADWRNMVASASVSGSECCLALPPSLVHHQVLRLPNMADGEVKEAAAWEMADRLNINKSSLQMDAYPIGTGGDVLVLAIELSTLGDLLDPMYEAGLQPSSIEPQCASVTRTMSMLHRRQSDQHTVRSVLDFGMHDSAFMVLAGDSMMFYKHLDYSGNELIRWITNHTGVTNSQAIRMLEQSKRYDVINDISKAVRNATRSIHESIATDAMKCIRHYGVTNRGPLSSELIITGSAGWNENLASTLSTACSQDVLQDVRLPHIQSLSSQKLLQPGWHVALGASLSSLPIDQERRGRGLKSKGAA